MSNGANVDAVDSHSVTALLRAAQKSHWQIVEVRYWMYIWLLLENGKPLALISVL